MEKLDNSAMKQLMGGGINDIKLSAATNNDLLALQNEEKEKRMLSAGLKVNSALDNPASFFASQSNQAVLRLFS